MRTDATPYSRGDWLALAAKMLPLVIMLAISLKFHTPKPPEPPVYRIDPGVSGLEFYNAGCSEQDSKHEYGYHFAKKDARCIFAELHAPPNRPETSLHVLFYDANGHIMKEENLPLTKELSPAILTTYNGWDEPGHWQPGIYHVELMIGSKLSAAGEFLITDP